MIIVFFVVSFNNDYVIYGIVEWMWIVCKFWILVIWLGVKKLVDLEKLFMNIWNGFIKLWIEVFNFEEKNILILNFEIVF